MFRSTLDGQFAEELSELTDGSMSLFVILPQFRSMMLSVPRASVLARFEALLGEHLAHLDGIVGDVLRRRARSDGDLTRSLFSALSRFRARPATAARDREMFATVQEAQLFLLGSCRFALRFARQAQAVTSVHVLEDSLARLGSLVVQSEEQDVVDEVVLASAGSAA